MSKRKYQTKTSKATTASKRKSASKASTTTGSNLKVTASTFAPVKPVVVIKPKLVMPLHVYDQIQYLCKEISAVEWSGVLFYDVEGSIKDPANLVFTLVDILPMHKGTQAYTEYELGSEVVEYMMDNPVLMTCKMGHIHSHNNMSVFFSGTDMEELHDNAPNHNVYLSLIVNNKMEFCAKVAYEIREMANNPRLVGREVDGTEYVLEQEEGEVVINSTIEDYDCLIECPKSEIEVTNIFKTNVEKIIKKAARVVPSVGTGSWNSVTRSWEPYGTTKGAVATTTKTTSSVGNSWVNPHWAEKDVEETPELIVDTVPPSGSIANLSAIDIVVKNMGLSDRLFQLGVEDFCIYLCNFGKTSEHETLDSILAENEDLKVVSTVLSNHIVWHYKAHFKNFFAYYLAKENNPHTRQKFYDKVRVAVISNFNYVVYQQGSYNDSIHATVSKYLNSTSGLSLV